MAQSQAFRARSLARNMLTQGTDAEEVSYSLGYATREQLVAWLSENPHEALSYLRNFINIDEKLQWAWNDMVSDMVGAVQDDLHEERQREAASWDDADAEYDRLKDEGLA